MAKDKERTLNPAAQQRKLEKQKALKKGKAAVTAQRNERLAHRNPQRLESQIADLQALKESQGGKLGGRDARHLEELERDARQIRKAREAFGDRAPSQNAGAKKRDEIGDTARTNRGGGNDRGRGRGGYTGLGKRRREGHDDGEESETTDEEARQIPWPRDTPPPLPPSTNSTNANMQPLGRIRPHMNIVPDTTLPSKPSSDPDANPDASAESARAQAQPKIQKEYSSAPQIRNLRAEAVKAFMPSIVRQKLDSVKGRKQGSLLEESDVQDLEKGGYYPTEPKAESTESTTLSNVSESQNAKEDEAARLKAELDAWERDIGSIPDPDDSAHEVTSNGGTSRQAMVEDVDDEES